MASYRPFPVNPVQTAVSISYSNSHVGFIADDVLPRVPVAADAFKWNYLPPAQAFTVPRTEVGRRGMLERVEFTGEERSDFVRDYGLESSVPISDIESAAAQRAAGVGGFDPLNAATEMLTDLLLTDREARVAAKIQDPASYAPANRMVLSGASQFSDPDSDVIGTLKTVFNIPLIFRPNTMTMGREVWGGISSHPQLVNAIRGNVSSKGIITPEEFVRLFSGEGLKKLNIGESFINSSKPGQIASLTRIWGKHISLTYLNPAARPEHGATFGMTAVWGSRIAGSWEEKNVGLVGGMVVRVGERVKEVITAPEAGFLLQNAVR